MGPPSQDGKPRPRCRPFGPTDRISLWEMAPGLVKFMMPVSLRLAISTDRGSSSGSTVMELGMSITLSYL